MFGAVCTLQQGLDFDGFGVCDCRKGDMHVKLVLFEVMGKEKKRYYFEILSLLSGFGDNICSERKHKPSKKV